MYMGGQAAYTHTYSIERKVVSGRDEREMERESRESETEDKERERQG